MPYECDYETLWQERPYILTANTYRWHGFYGNAGARHRQSLKYLSDVEQWYKRIASCLVKKKIAKKRDLKIELNEDDECVYFYNKDKVISSFCITSSRSNVYKKQDTRELKKILRKEIGNKEVKILKSEPVDNLPTNLQNLFFNGDIVVRDRTELGSILPKKGIALTKIGRRNYISNVSCTGENCRIEAIPINNEEKIIEEFAKADMCGELLNVLPEKYQETAKQKCMEHQLKKISFS